MKSREEIERAAEDALNSLDGIRAAEANEFLYTRVINRMQHDRQGRAVRGQRLMVRLGLCLGLFVCVNGVSFYMLNRNKPANQSSAGSSAFAREYQLNGQQYNY